MRSSSGQELAVRCCGPQFEVRFQIETVSKESFYLAFFVGRHSGCLCQVPPHTAPAGPARWPSAIRMTTRAECVPTLVAGLRSRASAGCCQLTICYDTVESGLMSRIETGQCQARDTRYATCNRNGPIVAMRHTTLNNTLAIARDCLHAFGKNLLSTKASSQTRQSKTHAISAKLACASSESRAVNKYGKYARDMFAHATSTPILP